MPLVDPATAAVIDVLEGIDSNREPRGEGSPLDPIAPPLPNWVEAFRVN